MKVIVCQKVIEANELPANKARFTGIVNKVFAGGLREIKDRWADEPDVVMLENPKIMVIIFKNKTKSDTIGKVISVLKEYCISYQILQTKGEDLE